MCIPGTEPDGFVKGRLMDQDAKNRISSAMTKNNQARKGKLQKICIVKDNCIKCIGSKNLQKYLDIG